MLHGLLPCITKHPTKIIKQSMQYFRCITVKNTYDCLCISHSLEYITGNRRRMHFGKVKMTGIRHTSRNSSCDAVCIAILVMLDAWCMMHDAWCMMHTTSNLSNASILQYFVLYNPPGHCCVLNAIQSTSYSA
jgi:hypothetical protein